MAIQIESDAKPLAEAFERLSLDDLLILACRFREPSSIQDITGRINAMLGYEADEKPDFNSRLVRSVINHSSKGYVIDYYGISVNSVDKPTKMYVLTETGLVIRRNVFDKLVDSLPKEVRKYLLEVGKNP